MVDVKKPAIAVAIVFLLVASVMLLAGCSTPQAQPPFVTTEMPAVPSECVVGKVRPTPKLPANVEIDDAIAAKDSKRLNDLLEVERSNRRACEERLRIILQQKDKTA